jgi:hypothetical protein
MAGSLVLLFHTDLNLTHADVQDGETLPALLQCLRRVTTLPGHTNNVESRAWLHESDYHLISIFPQLRYGVRKGRGFRREGPAGLHLIWGAS